MSLLLGHTICFSSTNDSLALPSYALFYDVETDRLHETPNLHSAPAVWSSPCTTCNAGYLQKQAECQFFPAARACGPAVQCVAER